MKQRSDFNNQKGNGESLKLRKAFVALRAASAEAVNHLPEPLDPFPQPFP